MNKRQTDRSSGSDADTAPAASIPSPPVILYLLATPLLLLSTALVWQPTSAKAGGYEARALPGMLAFEGVQLIQERFLFEEVVSRQIGCELGVKGNIIFKPDSVGVRVWGGAEWDTVFVRR